jgi:glycosyltransferase involved in cell wall biosynthesis
MASTALNVLHVTDLDLPGRHFNGYDLLDPLASRGIESRQAVLRKTSGNGKVIQLLDDHGDARLQRRIQEMERRHSINNLLQPWARVLVETAAFREADVVHYHLIHNRVISVYDLEWLFALKPSVWSFHDPWPLTGHCIQPMDSQGWLTGCAPCPYLRRAFVMKTDRAGEMWKIKQRAYANVDIDVVVASAWMLDMVRRSPLTGHFQNVHLIPFGIDPGFLSVPDRASSRRTLGIPDESFVLFFRSSPWELKGLPVLIEALKAARPVRPTTLLTVDKRGLLKQLRRDYQVVELGWVNDDARLKLAFAAADVFVMPSLAEGFGLMAVEAMAAARPVICFEGTALPAITHAPDCGIAVPMGDATALRAALDRLALDPAEGAERGALGRRLVETEYAYESYLDSMAALYRHAFDRPRYAGGSIQ